MVENHTYDILFALMISITELYMHTYYHTALLIKLRKILRVTVSNRTPLD